MKYFRRMLQNVTNNEKPVYTFFWQDSYIYRTRMEIWPHPYIFDRWIMKTIDIAWRVLASLYWYFLFENRKRGEQVTDSDRLLIAFIEYWNASTHSILTTVFLSALKESRLLLIRQQYDHMCFIPLDRKCTRPVQYKRPDRMNRSRDHWPVSCHYKRRAGANTVQPSVQGQEGGSTLTDRLVPRHVTPGNSSKLTLPLFLLSILHSNCSAPPQIPTPNIGQSWDVVSLIPSIGFLLPSFQCFLQSSSPWPSSEGGWLTLCDEHDFAFDVRKSFMSFMHKPFALGTFISLLGQCFWRLFECAHIPGWIRITVPAKIVEECAATISGTTEGGAELEDFLRVDEFEWVILQLFQLRVTWQPS